MPSGWMTLFPRVAAAIVEDCGQQMSAIVSAVDEFSSQEHEVSLKLAAEEREKKDAMEVNGSADHEAAQSQSTTAVVEGSTSQGSDNPETKDSTAVAEASQNEGSATASAAEAGALPSTTATAEADNQPATIAVTVKPIIEYHHHRPLVELIQATGASWETLLRTATVTDDLSLTERHFAPLCSVQFLPRLLTQLEDLLSRARTTPMNAVLNAIAQLLSFFARNVFAVMEPKTEEKSEGPSSTAAESSAHLSSSPSPPTLLLVLTAVARVQSRLFLGRRDAFTKMTYDSVIVALTTSKVPTSFLLEESGSSAAAVAESMEALVRSWLAESNATTQQGGSQSTSSRRTRQRLLRAFVSSPVVFLAEFFAAAFTPSTTPNNSDGDIDSSTLLVAEHGENLWREATSTLQRTPDGEFFDRMYGPLVIPSCQLLERLLTSLLGEGGIREGDPNTALLLAFAEAALRTLEKSQPPHRQQVLPFAIMFLASIGISAKGVPSLTFVEMLAKRMIGSMVDSTNNRNNTEQTAAEQQQVGLFTPSKTVP